ncbi:NACHT domain-containing protein [Actinokineospora sp. HUAS TT18]|uniref:NACHT domain-containing protein n=1 Tax=Actinokineospora sp. HUAS TT18 TaxID=3447451 RepID=UPI003F524D5A
MTTAVTAVGREVWKRRQKVIVDRVDRRLGQLTSRFAARYRDHVLGHVRYVEVKGLATVGFASPEFDDVYVDVSIAPTPPHAAGTGLLATSVAPERHAVGDFLDQKDPRILAVVGAPGGGKTTLLRHTARELCRSTRGRRRTVPILLYLRDHVRAIVDQGAPLPAVVRATLGRHAKTEPEGWFDQRLHAGDCLVMFDGLDEVARAEDRERISAWVELQAEQYRATTSSSPPARRATSTRRSRAPRWCRCGRSPTSRSRSSSAPGISRSSGTARASRARTSPRGRRRRRATCSTGSTPRRACAR